MEIRDEIASDISAIRKVVTSAFGRSGEARLVDRLRQEGDSVLSLVAVEEGAVIGHILLSGLIAPFAALGLAPISVAPARQRAGVGGALIRAALDRAAGGRWEGVFVLGDPRYYTRFGFDADATRGFASPYAGPHFMALSLRGEFPLRTGAIEYPAAFSAME